MKINSTQCLSYISVISRERLTFIVSFHTKICRDKADFIPFAQISLICNYQFLKSLYKGLVIWLENRALSLLVHLHIVKQLL